MFRQLWCVLTALVFWAELSATGQNEATARPGMPKNVILMGWDGARWDPVKALLKDGKLPNLQALVDAGTLVDINVTSGATDTKAGWTQILTGYKPEKTGVYNNARFKDVPEGYSVFERLRAAYGKEAVATVAVIGKKAHCGEIDAPYRKKITPGEEEVKENGPDLQPDGAKGNKGRIVEENGSRYMVFEGSPYFTMHNNVDEWHFGLLQDAKVGDKTLEMLDKYKTRPFFFFVHCAEVDHSGHKHREGSNEYNDAIISGDAQLGRIVEKLKALGLFDKTLIYVTADHGFDVEGTSHRNAPYVFLGTNDKRVLRRGMRADITPTVLDALGVDISGYQPPLDGESLLKAATKEEEPVVKGGGKKAGKTGKRQKANKG